MPGAPIVIGNYNSTIFLGRDLQFCTELDTKEKTVSRLIRRSLPRICARLKQDNFQTGGEQGFGLLRGSPRIKFGARLVRRKAHGRIIRAQEGLQGVEN
jgi:hypothetical protein